MTVMLIFAVLLFPVCIHYEDGGSVGYKALLYEIIQLHEIGGNDEANPYIEGIEIKILGVSVYRNTDE